MGSSLKTRLLFFLLILFVYRFAVHVVVPGVDPSSAFVADSCVLSLFNLFSGGALSKLSVLSLGLIPYISASIVVQVLSMPFGVPFFVKMKKEVGGNKLLIKYTRYLALLFAVIQSFFAVFVLNTFSGSLFIDSFSIRLFLTFSLVFGAMFSMWLGERLSLLQLGNGVSILIFFGILSGLPSALSFFFDLIGKSAFSFSHFIFICVVILLFIFVVFVESSQRRLMVSRSMSVGRFASTKTASTVIPFKLNVSGVVPAIFASSLMLLPVLIVSRGIFSSTFLVDMFSQGSFVYSFFFAIFIFFFSFFYASVVVNPRDVAENLRKSSTFVPGIRPGFQTEKYLSGVVSRLTFFGSLYVVLVCLLPMVLASFFSFPFSVGGTSILIIVVVAMDMLVQFQLSFYPDKYRRLIETSGLAPGGKNVL
jgi:preprotein translocase subunit SecY